MEDILFASLKESIFSTEGSVLSKVQNLALMLIPLFLVFDFGTTIVSNFFEGEKSTPNFKKLFIGLLLWILVSSYVPLVTGLDSTMNLITGSVTTEYSNMDVFTAKLKSIGNTQDNPDPDWDFFDALLGFTDMVMGGVRNIVFEFLLGALAGIVNTLSTLLTLILIIVGPLALAFQILPVTEGTIKHWLTSFISIKCWALTSNIILALFGNYLTIWGNGFKGDQRALYETIIGNQLTLVCFIILFLMVPIITGYYIKSAGNQMLTAVMGAGSTVFAAGKMAPAIMTGGTSVVAGKAFTSLSTVATQTKTGATNVLNKIGQKDKN